MRLLNSGQPERLALEFVPLLALLLRGHLQGGLLNLNGSELVGYLLDLALLRKEFGYLLGSLSLKKLLSLFVVTASEASLNIVQHLVGLVKDGRQL